MIISYKLDEAYINHRLSMDKFQIDLS